jgi:hypothetical protein
MTRLVLLAGFVLVSALSAHAAEPPDGMEDTDRIKVEVRGTLVCKDATSAYVRVYRDEGFGLEEDIRIYFHLSEGEWKHWKNVLPKLHDQTVTVTGSLGQIRKGTKTSIPEGALYFAGTFDIKPAAAPEEKKGEEKKDPTRRVFLQYRTVRDARAPSKFVAIAERGLSGIELVWDLPKLDDKAKQEAQDKARKEFDELIKRFEAKEINGVEFECRGEWLENRKKLRVTTVPVLTEHGKKRIKESDR